MGAIKRKLPGSSMIEAIVASLVFLAVFVISLSTITGFTVREDEGYVLLEAERRLSECSERYGDGTWAEETYSEDFEWGAITVSITPYKEFKNIQAILLRAKVKNSRKEIEYRRLIVKKDE